MRRAKSHLQGVAVWSFFGGGAGLSPMGDNDYLFMTKSLLMIV